jgi:hypothetical protein
MPGADSEQRYVPILKWREAEAAALYELSPNVKAATTPLLELVPPSESKAAKMTLREYIDEEVKRIAGNWGTANVFVDVLHLAPDPAVYPLAIALDRARHAGLRIIPVSSTTSGNDVLHPARNALRTMRRGVCLRERLGSFNKPSFPDALARTIRELDASPGDIDLLLDLEHISYQPMIPTFIAAAIERIPDLSAFRSFTVACSSFPLSLSHLPAGTHRLERADWFLWRAIRDSLRVGTRSPGYGDYSIVHPKLLTGGRIGTATLRYTTHDSFVIARGRSLEQFGFSEYNRLAREFVVNDVYLGRGYSKGDAFLHDNALGRAGTGTQGQWIQLGVNHHLTYVVRQLASQASRDTDFGAA